MLKITLEDATTDVPANEKAKACDKYLRTLTKMLGEENLVPAFKAWQTAQEVSESDLTKDDKLLVKQYQVAALRAMQDGFSSLGEMQGAYFDVRISHD